MENSKHILVLGATGASGLEFVKAALTDTSKPHLTLLVRTPSKLPSKYVEESRISIVEGQLNDSVAVNKAIKGVTSVVSFLGGYITLHDFVVRGMKTPIADSLPTIFDAMRAEGVKRFLALSTPGAFLLPDERLSWSWWFFVQWMPRFINPAIHADLHKIGEVVSTQHDLEWTVFRVPYLNDNSVDLVVKAGYVGPSYDGTLKLSRRSLVRWVLGELKDGAWVGKAPVVSNS